jgi:hypothetical protein
MVTVPTYESLMVDEDSVLRVVGGQIKTGHFFSLN